MSDGAVRLQRKAKGERPYFFDDPSVDKVVAMVMGLAGEVAILRDRQDTLERLLESKGLIKRHEIESFVVTDKIAGERAVWRETFLGEILRIVALELEAAASADSAPYDSAIELVERPGSANRKRARARR
jgi:hypothetical protein